MASIITAMPRVILKTLRRMMGRVKPDLPFDTILLAMKSSKFNYIEVFANVLKLGHA